LHRLPHDKQNEFLALLCRGREVFALEKVSPPPGAAQERTDYRLVRAETWEPDKHTLGTYRPVEPLKGLVFRPREYLGALAAASGPPPMKERIVIGVKNCDLSALQVHDHVFLGDDPVADPFYEEAREKTILVSCDCTDALDVCFCPIVNEQPYAKKGFDINISPTPTGYLVEAGSERGEGLLNGVKHLLEPADDVMIQKRDANRDKVTQLVCDSAKEKGLACGTDLRQAVEKTLEGDLWDDFAEDCVECGACNLICCTCHSFLMADGMSRGAPARVKQWDSCLYRNFARVAGGANPRKHRAERLYNRFEKKFSFFPETLGIYACDGCGRCVQACAGKIDIRDVLKRAIDES